LSGQETHGLVNLTPFLNLIDTFDTDTHARGFLLDLIVWLVESPS